MSVTQLSIKGLQEAQADHLRLVAAMRPGGAFERSVQKGTMAAHRYAVQITPVDTGAWRASHRMEVRGSEGRLFIDPPARNPRSGQLVSRYADVWAGRGGRLAIYDRTNAEAGERVLDEAEGQLMADLP